MLDYSPALMTDMYEYTMLDACLRDGTANRKCVFEIFTRHLPIGRHYGVAAGQGRILDALENFHLDDNDLKFLADRKVVGPETIKWLENFHFSGSIKGYREGEMFFPNSPILQAEGTFGECTLLVDTYNIEEAVKTAVEVAGPELGGVRIDSGDLASLAQRVRNQLDALGATNTKITVTNDLDEYALASLQTAPVDSYGVGTMLVTGSGAPTCAMVYKLTERENSAGDMQPVAKKSKDKATVPGRKLAFRSYEYSLADCEHVISGSEKQLASYQPEEGWKDLLVDYVTDGEINSDYQGHEAIVNAHNYRAQALAELPIGAQSLMKGDPVIPTEITVL